METSVIWMKTSVICLETSVVRMKTSEMIELSNSENSFRKAFLLKESITGKSSHLFLNKIINKKKTIIPNHLKRANSRLIR